MSNQVRVRKRDGSLEPLDLNKFHRVVEFACEGITGVSASEVELRSQIQFYDGIKTSDVQETLIRAAADLITEETPNYQWVAGRLVSYHVRKQVWGSSTPPSLLDHVRRVVEAGFYDPVLLEYDAEEFEELERAIDHGRDDLLTHAAMDLMRTKYLVRDRARDVLYETPQLAMMAISMTLFSGYPKGERIRWVVDFYDALSRHEISLPTPIMAGVRTPQRQFSSCVLIDSGDSLDSMNASASSIVKYVSQKAGIGLNVGRIRAIGSPVRRGDAVHTGIIPFLKYFAAAVKSCSQGGVRSGAATFCYPLWHLEVESLLVLKNNRGIEENRIRHVDYCVQLNRVMYERLLSEGNITLFSPSDVPGLYEAFFTDVNRFRELYERYEADPTIRKKTVPAVELFSTLMQERKDTGRVYVSNVDHVNDHGAFRKEVAPVYMTNLCVAGDTTVTVMLESGEIQDVQVSDVPTLCASGNVKVWSRNVRTGKLEFKDVTAAVKTSPSARVMRVTDVKTGYSVVCTPEHRIYTKNRGYVRADELNATDELYVDAQTESLESRGQNPEEELLSIEYLDDPIEVYDLTVEGNENFFANGILVHNCVEISLPTRPLDHLHDPHGEIALCTLAAVNWGKVRSPADFERPCRLIVRALDALLDYQDYPVLAAREATRKRRPLGVGIVNLAYWLAKHGTTYSEPNLALLDEWAEAWSYYLIRASVDLARERGACPASGDTRYSLGVVPCDTRKIDVDELTPHVERLDWDGLRRDLREYGIRNSTLMALMPAETSAIVSNSTNGIEPPRALVSVKQSTDRVSSQVVPEIRRLKNRYDLLWDQASPIGYLSVCAVLQKWVDQAISVNVSYNPQRYEDERVPMSDLLEHLVWHYRYGGKNLYYMNTLDGAGEVVEREPETSVDDGDDATCDSCVL